MTNYSKELNEKLTRRIAELQKHMTQLGPVMRGSVVELANKCGNPNCCCAQGQKHHQYYFSVSKKGRTKMIFLGKSKVLKARKYSNNYKTMVTILEEMTEINMQLLKDEQNS